jgi:CRISPR/Cas system-associated protein Csx1
LSTTLAQLAVASQVQAVGRKKNCTLWLALLAHGCYNLLFTAHRKKKKKKNTMSMF